MNLPRGSATCGRITTLKVDHLDRPLGQENPRPRLSWQLESDERNVLQSAYQIWVASREELLEEGKADLWDSGRIESRKSFGITYDGVELVSRQRCWWRVQVWDEQGRPSDPSSTSWWVMGLLDPKDWMAEWLAAEDTATRADREAGLQWIWGSSRDDQRPRGFRFKFRLPVPARAGELFAVANNPFGLPSAVEVRVDRAVVAAEAGSAAGERRTIGSLGLGEHLITVEARPLPESVSSLAHGPQGMALFVRFQLVNGETLRIAAGLDWKTCLIDGNKWHEIDYDDEAWEAARVVPIEGGAPWPALPAMYLRREFVVDKPISKAHFYATALGAYEARLNGHRVGDALLTPEFSQYAKRVLYRVYDVTEQLQLGANALGLIVGDGWYASFDGRFAWGPPPRRVLAQLELTFVNGSRQTIATDKGWRITRSPILRSEIKVGETYDARLDQPGWDETGFDDSRWEQAEIAEAPAARLVAQTTQAIRAMQILEPRTMSQPKPGVYVFDFEQCFAGWCRLRVQGSRGTRIELRFAEVLMPSGEVDPSPSLAMGEPKIDVFILRGDPSGETFEPRFTYRGLRYLQVTGLPAAPSLESVAGIVVHSDLAMTGTLRIDHALIQRIWRNTLWAQRSNVVGIPTDCPSREQNGWLADAGIFWDAATFNMDVCAFTSRQMANVTDDQAPDGLFPMFAPVSSRMKSSDYFTGGSPPAWGDGGVILPWTAWRRYGDLAVVERNWEAMNRYLRFIENQNPDFIWRNKRGPDFGDWLSVDQLDFLPNTTTPRDLIGTAYWAHSADLMAQMAQALGRLEEAARLRALFERVRRAFMDAFVAADGKIGNGSQTSYILALQFNLIPERLRQAAAERLAADIRGRGVALSCGFLGTQFILDVLADAGLADLAYSLLLRTEYPSWGYMIENGATALWENWRGEIEQEGGAIKTSQNHHALGSICGFLFRRIAGIDAATPGFTTVGVRPALDPRVRRGGGDYHSVMGRISTDWAWHDDGRFTLEVLLPANSTARIHLPARRGARIQEGQRDVSGRTDVRLVERSAQEAIIEVGSGLYQFAVIG